MDNMAEKISELLGSEEGLRRLKETANALFSENGGDAAATESGLSDTGDLASLLPEGLDIGKLLSILSALKSSGTDDRTALITALMPHLSYERRLRAEKAVKLIKIISVLPAVKQAGLLDII